MKDATRVFRGGNRNVSFDASSHIRAIVHHLNVLVDAHHLRREDEETSMDIYRERRFFKNQRRAIRHELMGLVDLYDAPDDVRDVVVEGLTDTDTTVAVELNVGQFTSGIDVYEGNKHIDADESFSVGVGPINPMKRNTLEQINDEAYVRDEGALLFVFTGHSESIHIGFSSYDRTNEAVIADPKPSLRERLFGDPY